nr:integrase, catalytic region, zinc finger, CCHC-type, peptidase aspartic, catalytic [Tanacetum cinerariifolium]
MSNVSHPQHYSPSSSTPPSTYVPPHLIDNAHLDSGLSPMDNLIENLTNMLALLTQSYKTFLPQTNNQLRTSFNTRNQATVQDGRVVVQNVQGQQNRGQGTNPQGGGAAGYEGVQNRVGNANPCGQDNAIDEDVDEQPVQDLALNVDNVFQDDDCDAFDFDVDEALTTKTMFMANLSSYNELNKVAIGYKNPLCLTRAKQVQPALYNGHEIIKDNHVSAIVCNTEDTLKIAEITRRKINDKMKDPESTFTEMHVANTIVETRCLELEAEVSNLRDKSQNDNHDELVKRFFNLEVHHLNLQLKYQNLKDSFENNPPTPDKDTPDFDSVFVIGKMQASLQGKDNVIKKIQKQISHLQETRIEADRTLDFRALDSQITQLTTKVTVLQAQNDMFRAENDKIKQHYKELYDFINITVSKDHVKPKFFTPGKYGIDVEPIIPRLRNNREAHLDYLRHLKKSVETIHDIIEEDSHQRDKKHAPAPLIRKKRVTFEAQCDKSNINTHKHVAKLNTQKTNVPVPPSTEVNCCTDASGSQPRSNTKKNRISPAKGCLKHMMGEKFIETVRIRNDHFGAIMGYGDYVIGNSVISRVYYVEGLGHNLFSVGQFCYSDMEVAFRKHSCYVRDTDGVELTKGSRGSNLYTISVEDMMKSSPIYLLSKATKNKS